MGNVRSKSGEQAAEATVSDAIQDNQILVCFPFTFPFLSFSFATAIIIVLILVLTRTQAHTLTPTAKNRKITKPQVFSKQSCGYCDAVKHILQVESKKVLNNHDCTVPQIKVIELDDRRKDEHVQRNLQIALYNRTGCNTVPQVFINQAFVGGADHTVRLSKIGALRVALMQAARCPLPPTLDTPPSSPPSPPTQSD